MTLPTWPIQVDRTCLAANLEHERASHDATTSSRGTLSPLPRDLYPAVFAGAPSCRSATHCRRARPSTCGSLLAAVDLGTTAVGVILLAAGGGPAHILPFLSPLCQSYWLERRQPASTGQRRSLSDRRGARRLYPARRRPSALASRARVGRQAARTGGPTTMPSTPCATSLPVAIGEPVP